MQNRWVKVDLLEEINYFFLSCLDHFGIMRKLIYSLKGIIVLIGSPQKCI